MWAGILLGIIGGNAIGLALYFLLVTPEPEEPPPPPEPTTTLPDSQSRAHRLAGLDAIERGDHDAAIREFSAALRAPSPAPDLPQLLSIAQNMKEREEEQAREQALAEAAAAREDEEPSARNRERERPQVVRPTLLLITTRPDSLPVEVDGRVRDLSPAKIEVKPGQHTVGILQGDKRIFERRIDVGAGQVSLIDADLTGLVVPESEEDPDATDDPPLDAGVEVEVDDASVTDGGSSEESVADGSLAAPGSPSPSEAARAARLPPAEAPPSEVRSEPPPEVRRAPPPRVEPSPTRQQVRQVAARFRDAFQSCYLRHRDRQNASGRVVVRVDVDTDGQVSDARIASSDLPSFRLKRCITRKAKGMEFPKPSAGPKTVSFGLRFQPDS